MRLKQGLIEPPAGDIVTFFRHDGTPPARARTVTTPDSTAASRSEPTLADLRGRYIETHANGTLEPHTLKGIRRHFGHLARTLGESFPIRNLTLADLPQGYDRQAGQS